MSGVNGINGSMGVAGLDLTSCLPTSRSTGVVSAEAGVSSFVAAAPVADTRIPTPSVATSYESAATIAQRHVSEGNVDQALIYLEACIGFSLKSSPTKASYLASLARKISGQSQHAAFVIECFMAEHMFRYGSSSTVSAWLEEIENNPSFHDDNGKLNATVCEVLSFTYARLSNDPESDEGEKAAELSRQAQENASAHFSTRELRLFPVVADLIRLDQASYAISLLESMKVLVGEGREQLDRVLAVMVSKGFESTVMNVLAALWLTPDRAIKSKANEPHRAELLEHHPIVRDAISALKGEGDYAGFEMVDVDADVITAALELGSDDNPIALTTVKTHAK